MFYTGRTTLSFLLILSYYILFILFFLLENADPPQYKYINMFIYILLVIILVNDNDNPGGEDPNRDNYPPAGTPETPAEEKKGFLEDGMPLRLSAEEITNMVDAIVLLPKGSSEPTELAAQMRLSKVNIDLEKMTVKCAELTKANEELTKTKAELELKIQAIDDAKRLELATGITDVRIEKGLLSKDDKEDAVKKLALMSEEQLTVALEDYKAYTGETPAAAPKTGTEPPATTEQNLAAGETDEKKQKRMEMFGHEAPIDEHLKEHPNFASAEIGGEL